MKKLEPISKEELKKRVKTIGTQTEVAEMLSYSLGGFQHILYGIRPQNEKFLFRFRELENDINNRKEEI